MSCSTVSTERYWLGLRKTRPKIGIKDWWVICAGTSSGWVKRLWRWLAGTKNNNSLNCMHTYAYNVIKWNYWWQSGRNACDFESKLQTTLRLSNIYGNVSVFALSVCAPRWQNQRDLCSKHSQALSRVRHKWYCLELVRWPRRPCNAMHRCLLGLRGKRATNDCAPLSPKQILMQLSNAHIKSKLKISSFESRERSACSIAARQRLYLQRKYIYTFKQQSQLISLF